MEESYKISMQKIIEEFHLETIYLPDLPENIFVTCSRVNRPGLQMVGFYDHYEQARLQIIGKVENLFVSQLPKEERSRRLEDFFRSKPSGVIITTSIDVSADTVAIAEKYQVPILRTAERTSDFMAALIAPLCGTSRHRYRRCPSALRYGCYQGDREDRPRHQSRTVASGEDV